MKATIQIDSTPPAPATHTPAPWRAEGGNILHGETVQDTRPMGGTITGCVAKVQGSALRNYKANARLIAAAPELLAALMESMPAIRHAVTVAEIGTRSTSDPAIYGKRVAELAEAKQRLARAQAAIDKATKSES